MTNKNTIKYSIFLCFSLLFCLTGNVFAYLNIHTFLGILPPPYQVEYSPPHIAWQYTSWAVYVSITGNGIMPNTTGIRNNGTYTFDFYRGTGPFTTWAGYSSGNTRTLLKTTKTIDRIDNILPAFVGVVEGNTYTTPVTITFSDNLPGVTTTLNNSPFANGTTISTNGTYQLIVTDIAGNRTWATFIIYLNNTPPPPPSWWGWIVIDETTQDNCMLPSSLACANTIGQDYSPSYYDNTCCVSSEDNWSSLGARELIEAICKNRNCYSSYYDSVCGTCTPWEDSTPPDIRPPFHHQTPDSPIIIWSTYSQERNNAYQRAYKLWITTISPIQEANLEWVLYRKIAAKMISEFALKVVWLIPDETRICTFTDISKEDPELQYYMKLSCQLWIMGLDYYGNPDTVFNPNYFVTRDQFVTILSRTLFRGKYNLFPTEYSFFNKAKNFAVHTLNNISNALKLNLQIDTPLDWYTKHLEIIKQLWVITDYRVNIKEFKIYVILIMYRMNLQWIEYIQSLW